MSSAVSVVLPPSPKPSISDLDDEEEDIEYEEIEEEIEVEEEVEVEEEIEEEDKYEEEGEGDDESDIGEALTPVHEENQVTDTTQYMEPKEHEEPIESASVTPGLPVSNPVTDIPTVQESVGDSKVSESSKKDSVNVKGERTSISNEPKVSFEDSGVVNDTERKLFVRDIDFTLTTNGASKEKDNDIQSVVAETNFNDVDFVEDMQISPIAMVEDMQISPRLHVPQLRLRDSSSSAEFEGDNKRQRIVCEFYAKGWCIKGTSCRFPHVKEGLDVAVHKSEGTKEASSNAYISPYNIAENSKLNGETEKSVLCKDDVLVNARLPPGVENFGQKSYHGSFSGCTVLSDYHYQNSRISNFETLLVERINKKSDIVRNHYSSVDMSHSHPRQPLFFGLSSWKADVLGTKKPWENNLERLASVSSSVQQSTSPFSCSEPENLSRKRISRDTDLAKHKAKISSNNWEPSIPFHPSHDITRNLLLKESLYDPIRDSIEQTEIRDRQMKSPFLGQGSSMINTHMKSHNSQEEDELLNSAHVGDTGKYNVRSSSHDNRLNSDKQKHEMEPKVDGSRSNDESGINFKKDGHARHEEKALKYFQAALIEFVKELVKPTWQEGLMSKDAHKLIVKKAVDKVLSTIQPHQIPSNTESVKLYLSSSQSKLAKLVEGYIEKYGKF